MVQRLKMSRFRIDYVDYYIEDREYFQGVIYKRVLGIWFPLFFKHKVNIGNFELADMWEEEIRMENLKDITTLENTIYCSWINYITHFIMKERPNFYYEVKVNQKYASSLEGIQNEFMEYLI